MNTGALPHPVRYMVAQLNELRPGDVPDMIEVGRLLMELADDEPLISPAGAACR
jgi:hypothetical protein